MKKRLFAAVTAAMMFTTILSVVPVNTLAIDSAEQSTSVSSSDLQLTISQGRTWDPNAEFTEKESGNYVVNDDYTIEEKNKDDILTVSVVDYDTGELILTDTDQCWSITLQAGFSVEYVLTDGTFAWGTAWEDLNTWSYGQLNPCEIDTSLYSTGFGIEDFKVVDMYIPEDYFLPEDYLEINYKESDEYHTDFPADITIKLKKTKMGDCNADGEFSVADVVLLQKWILVKSEAALSDWKAADFCEDGRLDVFDLTLMKRELLNKNQTVYTSFTLYDNKDIRTNSDAHTEQKAYIVNSMEELQKTVAENEQCDYLDSALENVDESFFAEQSLVLFYTQAGGGNKYTIVDSLLLSDSGETLNITAITKKPEIATPDMMYRRYAFAVNKNAVENVKQISYNETSSYYSYDEGNDVGRWFNDWCKTAFSK
ncbi:MAG: dockerin type I repeat-containing protein [Ruminococcus sp.]|nr:dockerin type I repeat-containing protein [Ruminococcus sp.]